MGFWPSSITAPFYQECRLFSVYGNSLNLTAQYKNWLTLLALICLSCELVFTAWLNDDAIFMEYIPDKKIKEFVQGVMKNYYNFKWIYFKKSDLP